MTITASIPTPASATVSPLPHPCFQNPQTKPAAENRVRFISRPIYLPRADTLLLLLRNLAGPAPPPPPVTTKELKEDTTEIHTGMFILIVICCCGAGLVAAGSIFLKVQERQVCPQSQTHSSHECWGE